MDGFIDNISETASRTSCGLYCVDYIVRTTSYKLLRGLYRLDFIARSISRAISRAMSRTTPRTTSRTTIWNASYNTSHRRIRGLCRANYIMRTTS